jgi:hypothetical protein
LPITTTFVGIEAMTTAAIGCVSIFYNSNKYAVIPIME